MCICAPMCVCLYVKVIWKKDHSITGSIRFDAQIAPSSTSGSWVICHDPTCSLIVYLVTAALFGQQSKMLGHQLILKIGKGENKHFFCFFHVNQLSGPPKAPQIKRFLFCFICKKSVNTERMIGSEKLLFSSSLME